ncbi:MAG: acetyl-CoA carboxylase carboxyltransferase subunit alpha [Butyrivibrio sp.]|nr:acetyl-CoA carboxylase carboxyltransferase subunit alpha [Butyrivibrio sp.]
MIRDILSQTEHIDHQIASLKTELDAHSKNDSSVSRLNEEISILTSARTSLLNTCTNLTAEDKVFLARHILRPHMDDIIGALFTDFFEQKGDHLYDEDKSILGGIARYKGIPVTVVGHLKGHTAQDNIKYNFGMPRPEGYRKALRLMEQAEKFRRPIITFVDTPGAYPGKEAEEHGQGEAIAKNLAAMSRLTVPVITIVTGEGNSGGALAISIANKILMLENAVYSVLSPEGFASILWKDSSRHAEACDIMKLTASDLLDAGVADEIIPEPLGGAQADPDALYKAMDSAIETNLRQLMAYTPEQVLAQRRHKFRSIGSLENNCAQAVN